MTNIEPHNNFKNKLVHICKHCHSAFKKQCDPQDHPLREEQHKTHGDTGYYYAYKYLEACKSAIGPYEVVTQPNYCHNIYCGVCGYRDEAHNFFQVKPYDSTMYDHFMATHEKTGFFEGGSIRFFDCSFMTQSVAGFFITREGTTFSDGSSAEGFTVRRYTNDGVETIGEFLEHDSCDLAVGHAAFNVLSSFAFWDLMRMPHEDTERGHKECSQMHIMAVERFLEQPAAINANLAFPVYREIFQNALCKAFVWSVADRDDFEWALRGYHDEKEEQNEEEERNF
tara:strand:+ start:1223 stop:2071 length:849 start_codon:yes stop_codon:yes gene_type:complete